MANLMWEASVARSRWSLRLRYLFRWPNVYRNWWSIVLPKMGIGVVLELRNGLKYFVRPRTTDLGVINEAALLKPYTGDGYFSLPEDAVVVDVGANIGDFSMEMARACPKGRVIAVEPVAEQVRCIEIQKLLNGFNNVFTAHVALGKDNDREIDIHVAGGHSSAWWGTGPTETVREMTLQRLMEQFDVDRIDLLKLDCEGAEWEILPAAEEILPYVRQICMEFHCMDGWTPEKLASWLTKRGYEVKHTPGDFTGLLWARRQAEPERSQPTARSSHAFVE